MFRTVRLAITRIRADLAQIVGAFKEMSGAGFSVVVNSLPAPIVQRLRDRYGA